jgi:hypothetical protein
MDIVEMYLSEQTDVAVGRQFLALATAGPPAAGKSSSIERPELAGQGGAVVDADRVKDYLLRDALDQGFCDDLLDL